MRQQLNSSWAYRVKIELTPESNGGSESREGAKGTKVLRRHGALDSCRSQARATRYGGTDAASSDGILGVVGVLFWRRIHRV